MKKPFPLADLIASIKSQNARGGSFKNVPIRYPGIDGRKVRKLIGPAMRELGINDFHCLQRHGLIIIEWGRALSDAD